MNCPNCGTKMEFEFRLTPGGGCCQNERCYCDSQDCHVEFACPKKGCRDKNIRYGYDKRVKVIPPGFTDQYAIGKFLQKYFEDQENKG